MKHSQFTSLFVALTFTLLSACGGNSSDKADPQDSLRKAANSNDSLQNTVQKTDSVVTDTLPLIEGSVYYTLPWCGGAKPTQEILAELKKEKPLTSSTLKLKNSSGDYAFTTDPYGKFSARIQPGYYKVYLTRATNPAIYSVTPETCENCLTEPITDVTLSAEKAARISFMFRCDPKAKQRP